MRIALLADLHLGDDRSETGEDAVYWRRAEATVGEVRKAGADAVLIAGDLTQNCRPDQAELFLSLKDRYEMPVLWVPGNHDCGDKQTETRSGSVTAESVAHYESLLGPSFYMTVLGEAAVMAVNTSLLGSGLSREIEQWDYLERELAAPRAGGAFVLLHYPPFLEAPDEPSDPYWNIEPGPRARLLSLLKKASVRAVFSGHIHRPMEHSWNGIRFITAPPVSFGLPPRAQPEGWSLVTANPDGTVDVSLQYFGAPES